MAVEQPSSVPLVDPIDKAPPENPTADYGPVSSEPTNPSKPVIENPSGEHGMPSDSEMNGFVPAAQYQELTERFNRLEERLAIVDHHLHHPAPQQLEADWIYDDPAGNGDVRVEREIIKGINGLMWSFSWVREVHARRKLVKEAKEARARENDNAENKLMSLDRPKAGQTSLDILRTNEKAKLRYFKWWDFKSLRSAKENVPESLLPLDVFLKDPDLTETEFGRHIKPMTEMPPMTGDSPLPARIRIFSVELRAVIYSLLDISEKHPDVWPPMFLPYSYTTTDILRPFKCLVEAKEKIRQLANELERELEPSIIAGKDSNRPEIVDAIDLKSHEKGGHPATETTLQVPEASATEASASTGNEAIAEAKKSVTITTQSDTESSEKKAESLIQIRCLLEFIDVHIEPKVEWVASPECQRILFDDLWFLLKPGDMVVGQTGKQGYRVIRVATPVHKAEPWWVNIAKGRRSRNSTASSDSNDSDDDDDDGDSPLLVYCAFLDFNGKQLGPVSRRFRIPRYQGAKAITTLPVFPIRFASDPDARASLIARGRKLLHAAKVAPMYCNGLTLETREEVDSQVMVDFAEGLLDDSMKELMPDVKSVEAFSEEKGPERCRSDCCNRVTVLSDTFIDNRRVTELAQTLLPRRNQTEQPSLMFLPRGLQDVASLSEDELFIMTHRVFAFVLRSRKWAQLDLSTLEFENEENSSAIKSAFEQLVLPLGHKDMIQALVSQHFRSKKLLRSQEELTVTDLIRGKGKGLIMLLHGAPGVGKTTTAEGVAELFKRPLFQITCGDLGTSAKEVQQELEKNFALASRWGCVLLLDEADVFLAQRERKDLHRNALVAVFLRVLEYYSGILFLTTNRIGDFDEAFASRVHMTLEYPELDADKTSKIFELNLKLIKNRFQHQGRVLTYDESAVEAFYKAHFKDHENKGGRWNGRQIRNACQTAVALAEFEAQGGSMDIEIDPKREIALKVKHFQTVQAAYVDFSKYLGDIEGTAGDERAVTYHLRARSSKGPSKLEQRASMKESQSNQYQGNPGMASPMGSPYISQQAFQGPHMTNMGYPQRQLSQMAPNPQAYYQSPSPQGPINQLAAEFNIAQDPRYRTVAAGQLEAYSPETTANQWPHQSHNDPPATPRISQHIPRQMVQQDGTPTRTVLPEQSYVSQGQATFQHGNFGVQPAQNTQMNQGHGAHMG